MSGKKVGWSTAIFVLCTAVLSRADAWNEGATGIITAPTGTKVGIGIASPNSALDINGSATVSSTLGVTGLTTASGGVLVNGGAAGAGRIVQDAWNGLYIQGVSGSSNDFVLTTPGGTYGLIQNPTGTANLSLSHSSGTTTIRGPAVMSSTLGVTGNFTNSRAQSGGQVMATIDNTSNTANSQARILVRTAGSSADDAFASFIRQGQDSWSIGLDASAGNSFKLSQSSALGTLDRLTVNSSGATFAGPITAGDGTGGPSVLINGAAGNNRNVAWRTNGVNRWFWRVTGSAESGSDAGSNMALVAFTDGGAEIDNPISITRASGGAMAISRPVNVASTLGVTELLSAAGGVEFGPGTGAPGRIFRSATGGLFMQGAAGTNFDFVLGKPDGTHLIRNPTGTQGLQFPGTGTSIFGITHPIVLQTNSAAFAANAYYGSSAWRFQTGTRFAGALTYGETTGDISLWASSAASSGADAALTRRFVLQYDNTNQALTIAPAVTAASTLGVTGNATFSRSQSGGQVLTTIANTSNTASSQARLLVQTAGASADDAFASFVRVGQDSWSLGLDASAGNSFKLSQSTSLGTLDRLTVNSSGATFAGPITAGDGTGGPSVLINGAAGNNRNVAWRTSGINRWFWRVTGSTENGNDAGSNMALVAFTDGGVEIDNPISITRAAGGAMAISRPVTMSSTLRVDGDLSVGTVKARGWEISEAPDYVFEKEYPLASLEKVESFIRKNKHLPEVPSAKKMKEEGLDLVKMNFLLLKKVEELTLHAIEQNKRLEGQIKMAAAQEKRGQELERQVRHLQAKVRDLAGKD